MKALLEEYGEFLVIAVLFMFIIAGIFSVVLPLMLN